jgi:hypothetical protein
VITTSRCGASDFWCGSKTDATGVTNSLLASKTSSKAVTTFKKGTNRETNYTISLSNKSTVGMIGIIKYKLLLLELLSRIFSIQTAF